MATMEYKGYLARIDVDEENAGFHGRVINIRPSCRSESTPRDNASGRTPVGLKQQAFTVDPFKHRPADSEDLVAMSCRDLGRAGSGSNEFESLHGKAFVNSANPLAKAFAAGGDESKSFFRA